MKKLLSAAVLLLLSISVYAGRPFTFVQITDPQFGMFENGVEKSTAYMEKTVEAINAIQPDFVVVTGDMINDRKDPSQLEAYKSILSKIDKDIPIWHVPGNHDYGSYSREHVDNYLAAYGYTRFSFAHKGAAFIGIDTCPIKDGDKTAEEEQYKWLEGELQKYSKNTPKVLFTHCPIVKVYREEAEDYFNFSKADREKYIALLQEYGVNAVLSGHFHRTRLCQVGDLMLYTTGSTTHPLDEGQPGFAIVRVKRGQIFYNFVTAGQALEACGKHK